MGFVLRRETDIQDLLLNSCFQHIPDLRSIPKKYKIYESIIAI